MQSPSAHGDSADESISDEENDVVSKFGFMSGAAEDQRSCDRNFQNDNHDEACSWYAILEEADELVCLQNKSHSSFISNISEERKTRKGARGRAKLKFSFPSHSYKDDLSCSSCVKDGREKLLDEATEGPSVLEQITMENSMAHLLGNVQGEIDGFHTKFVPHEQRSAIPSVAELLEDLQGNNAPSKGASNLLLQNLKAKEIDGFHTKFVSHEQRSGFPSVAEVLEDLEGNNASSKGASNLLLENVKAKERKTYVAGKRLISSLGSRILDNEDPPEFLGGGMSSEDEDRDTEIRNLTTQKMKGQTMTDLFQEAFSKSTVEESLLPISKHPRPGFHGRLQQMLQIEKDRHLEYLKKSQKEFSPCNEPRSIDVQILSRVLEAKLTVCHCLSGENIKSCGNGPQDCTGVGTTKRTIIFSSKICNHVDLEVGNFVRIHPPWKEVEVNEVDKIILYTEYMDGACLHGGDTQEGEMLVEYRGKQVRHSFAVLRGSMVSVGNKGLLSIQNQLML